MRPSQWANTACSSIRPRIIRASPYNSYDSKKAENVVLCNEAEGQRDSLMRDLERPSPVSLVLAYTARTHLGNTRRSLWGAIQSKSWLSNHLSVRRETACFQASIVACFKEKGLRIHPNPNPQASLHFGIHDFEFRQFGFHRAPIPPTINRPFDSCPGL